MKKLRTGRIAVLIAAAVLFSLVLSVSAFADYPIWIKKDIESSYSVPAGDTVSLAVEAYGGNGSLTYMWYNNSGATGCVMPYFSFKATTDDVVYCVVKSGSQSVESTHCAILTGVSPYNSEVPVTVPRIICQPKSVSVPYGQSTTLSVQAACAWMGAGVGLEYQWYCNTNGDMRYAPPISGATSPTYTVPASYTPARLYYTCVIHSTNGVDRSQDVYTDIVTVYCGDLNITKHPTGETVKVGGKATFIARADGAAAFQWRIVRNDGSNGFFRAEEAPSYINGLQVYGADTDTLVLDKIPMSMNGMSVICVFYADDARTQYKITRGALITVINPTPTPAPYIPTPTAKPTPTSAPAPAVRKILLAPSISVRPEAVLSADGKHADLSVIAVDNNDETELRFQWYRNSKNSNSGGTAVSGARSASYSPLVLNGSRYYYVCVWAVDGENASKAAYSEPVLVNSSTVSGGTLLAPSISVRPELMVADDGHTVSLSVRAVDNNPSGTSLKFQWYKNNKNSVSGGTVIPGAESESYVPANQSDSRYYYVAVWATDGTRTSKVAYSGPVLLGE